MANPFGWIGAWIASKIPPTTTAPNAPKVSDNDPVTPSAKQLAIFNEARKHEGWEENKNRAEIKAFIAKSGIRLDPVDLPWCAAFANGCCAAAGQKGTGSAMARSFLAVPRTFSPKKGDFVIFWRVSPQSDSGHVAFFVRFSPDKTKVLCLGGNQNNSVCYEWHDAKTVLGFSRIE